MFDDATEQLMSSPRMMRLNLTTTQRRNASKATFLERDEVLIINKTKQQLVLVKLLAQTWVQTLSREWPSALKAL